MISIKIQKILLIKNNIKINIVKIQKVFARVSVSENEIASIKKGDKVIIRIAALNNAEFEGPVEEIGVMADPIAHTYNIKIAIINKNAKLKPGMICNVIMNKTKDNLGLIVPSHSIMIDESGKKAK